MLDILQSRSLSASERGQFVHRKTRNPGVKMMFFGSITALVTPFSKVSVADDTVRAFVEWQIAEGSNALVPCGTTVEVAILSAEEHRQVVAMIVEAAQGR